MTPRLPRLTSKQLIKILQVNGWEHARTTGSHYIMVRPEAQALLSIPLHKRALSIGTLSRLVKDAGLRPEDLR